MTSWRRASLGQKIADGGGHGVRMAQASQVPATFDADKLMSSDAFPELSQAIGRNQEISIARKDERRDTDSNKPLRHIEALDQCETVGHDTLIGPPALSSGE